MTPQELKAMKAAVREAVEAASAQAGQINFAQQRAHDGSAAARQFGGDAIRMAFAINGGAIIAILTWLGSNNAPDGVPVLALVLFGAGALLAIGSSIAAYFSQKSFSDAYEVEVTGRAPSGGAASSDAKAYHQRADKRRLCAVWQLIGSAFAAVLGVSVAALVIAGHSRSDPASEPPSRTVIMNVDQPPCARAPSR